MMNSHDSPTPIREPIYCARPIASRQDVDNRRHFHPPTPAAPRRGLTRGSFSHCSTPQRATRKSCLGNSGRAGENVTLRR